MKERGFTLIELCISLSVLAILTATAAPSIGAMVTQFRATAAVNSLVSDLALARIAAISGVKPVTACPSLDAETCLEVGDWTEGWVVFVDPDRNGRVDPGERVLSAQQARKVHALSIRSTTGRPSVRYLPTGMASGTNLTVTACIGQRIHSRLIMNNAGRVRVERPSRPAQCPASSAGQ